MKWLANYKRNRAIEKQLIEEQKRIDAEVEKDYALAHPEEEKTKLLDILFDNDEIEKELQEYLTEEEKEELDRLEKESKRETMLVTAIFGGAALFIVVLMLVLDFTSKTDLEKVTMPLMQKYLDKKFGSNMYKVEEVHQNCKKDYEKNETTCEPLQYAELGDGKYVFALDNETLGDNIDTSKMVKEYQAFIKNVGNFSEISQQTTVLSYKDYQKGKFSYFGETMTALPDDGDFIKYYGQRKLTVVDVIEYNGTANYQKLQELLETFLEPSKFYLINRDKGIPTTITTITKNAIKTHRVIDYRDIDTKITYYDLSRETNNIAYVNYNKASNGDIKKLDNTYEIENGYFFQAVKGTGGGYYGVSPDSIILVKMKDIKYDRKNLRAIKYSKETGMYEEYKKEEAPIIIPISEGDSTYVLMEASYGDAGFGFGTVKMKKDTWSCINLGIC